MLQLVTLLLTVMLLASPGRAQFEPIATFGDLNFDVDTEGGTTLGFSQGPTTLTLNPPFTNGDTIGGNFTGPAYDWSGITSFGLLMSAPVSSPTSLLTFYLLDELNQIINTYEGEVTGLSAEPSVIDLQLLSLPGTGDLSSVGGMQFTWEGSGNSTVVINGLVPEPSTWALLGVAAAVLGGRMISRRRRN